MTKPGPAPQTPPASPRRAPLSGAELRLIETGLHDGLEAGRVLAGVLRLLDELASYAMNQQETMDDPHRDGSARDARPPSGDDWNELYARVIGAAETAELFAAGR